MQESPGRASGVRGKARRLGFAWAEAFRLRYELFSLEAKEQRGLWIGLLVQALVVSFCGFMAFLCANVLLLIALWDERVIVCSILAGVYFLVALVLGFWLRHRIVNFPAPFAATASELRRDAETLLRQRSL